MPRLGFIHDMMDVKVLILFVTARVSYPLTVQEIYELCFQDECLSYFDVCTAIPEMVASGHLENTDETHYVITEKGKQDGQMTADSIAFTVKQKAQNAVTQFERRIHRGNFINSRVITGKDGACSVVMTLNDSSGTLMTLELAAPSQRQAIRMGKLFDSRADVIYNSILTQLSEAETESDK